MRPPLSGQLVAEASEVVRPHVRQQAALAERGHDLIAGRLVVAPGQAGQLACIHEGLFRVQDGVGQFLDGSGFGVGPRLPPGVQIDFVFQILFEGGAGVGPRAEVDEPAANSLRPAFGGVREEREVGVGLGGLDGRGGRGSMRRGDGDGSLNRVSDLVSRMIGRT